MSSSEDKCFGNCCRETEKTAKAMSCVSIIPNAAALIMGLGSECYTVFKVIKRSEKCDLHNVIHHRCWVMNIMIAQKLIVESFSFLLFFLSLFSSSTWPFSLSFFVVDVLESVLSKLASCKLMSRCSTLHMYNAL